MHGRMIDLRGEPRKSMSAGTAGGSAYWTVTVPFMPGWIVQRYEYVPGAAGIVVDFVPDEKSPIDVIEELLNVTLCAVLSWFVQVTVALGPTRIAGGLNCKPLIDTDVVATGCVPPPLPPMPPLVPPVVPPVTESPPPHAAATTRTTSQRLRT